jgi:hypothetical protein
VIEAAAGSMEWPAVGSVKTGWTVPEVLAEGSAAKGAEAAVGWSEIKLVCRLECQLSGQLT